MADSPQVMMARMMWQQVRQAAQLQHQALQQVAGAQKNFLRSLQQFGTPVQDLEKQYDTWLEAEEGRYQQAMSQLEGMERSQLELLSKGFGG